MGVLEITPASKFHRTACIAMNLYEYKVQMPDGGTFHSNCTQALSEADAYHVVRSMYPEGQSQGD